MASRSSRRQQWPVRRRGGDWRSLSFRGGGTGRGCRVRRQRCAVGIGGFLLPSRERVAHLPHDLAECARRSLEPLEGLVGQVVHPASLLEERDQLAERLEALLERAE